MKNNIKICPVYFCKEDGCDFHPLVLLGWKNAVSEMEDSLGLGSQSSKVLIGKPQIPAPEFSAGRTNGPKIAECQSFIFSPAKKLAFCEWTLFTWIRTSHHVFIKNRWSPWYMTPMHSLAAYMLKWQSCIEKWVWVLESCIVLPFPPWHTANLETYVLIISWAWSDLPRLTLKLKFYLHQ